MTAEVGSVVLGGFDLEMQLVAFLHQLLEGGDIDSHCCEFGWRLMLNAGQLQSLYQRVTERTLILQLTWDVRRL